MPGLLKKILKRARERREAEAKASQKVVREVGIPTAPDSNPPPESEPPESEPPESEPPESEAPESDPPESEESPVTPNNVG
jgi:hypothetical protein